MELPTIRLEMGLQDLGRPQPDAELRSRARFLRNHLGESSRPADLAPAAQGAAWTPARAAGPGSRAAAGGLPQGRHAPLTRPGSGVGSAGWPRQRPLRGRVQGPGRGVGTAGEAVPPHRSGPPG